MNYELLLILGGGDNQLPYSINIPSYKLSVLKQISVLLGLDVEPQRSGPPATINELPLLQYYSYIFGTEPNRC